MNLMQEDMHMLHVNAWSFDCLFAEFVQPNHLQDKARVTVRGSEKEVAKCKQTVVRDPVNCKGASLLNLLRYTGFLNYMSPCTG